MVPPVVPQHERRAAVVGRAVRRRPAPRRRRRPAAPSCGRRPAAIRWVWRWSGAPWSSAGQRLEQLAPVEVRVHEGVVGHHHRRPVAVGEVAVERLAGEVGAGRLRLVEVEAHRGVGERRDGSDRGTRAGRACSRPAPRRAGRPRSTRSATCSARVTAPPRSRQRQWASPRPTTCTSWRLLRGVALGPRLVGAAEPGLDQEHPQPRHLSPYPRRAVAGAAASSSSTRSRRAPGAPPASSSGAPASAGGPPRGAPGRRRRAAARRCSGPPGTGVRRSRAPTRMSAGLRDRAEASRGRRGRAARRPSGPGPRRPSPRRTPAPARPPRPTGRLPNARRHMMSDRSLSEDRRGQRVAPVEAVDEPGAQRRRPAQQERVHRGGRGGGDEAEAADPLARARRDGRRRSA